MKNVILFLFSIFSVFTYAQSCAILDAGADITVDSNNNCVTLSGAFNGAGIGASSVTYRIDSAPSCNFQIPATVNPAGLTSDDSWSPVIHLPFTFEFFGQAKDSLLVGENGLVSFDTDRTTPQMQKPLEFCAWSLNTPLPDVNLFRNTIYGAYHDMDLTRGGSVKYFITGTAPQRRFVVEFDSVPHYNCNDLFTTQYIILNETSNIIDVYIEHKDACTTWNNGYAVIGIQNEAGDEAYIPAGRQTGIWTVNAPELWRFIPDTNPQNIYPDFSWYDDATGTLLGTGLQLDVCVNQDTTYRFEATYLDPVTGQNVLLKDWITVFHDSAGTLDEKNNELFSLFPNPATDQCVIKLKENKALTKLELVDVTGKIIQSIYPEQSVINMDLSTLEKSIYYIRVYQDKQMYVSKLIKL